MNATTLLPPLQAAEPMPLGARVRQSFRRLCHRLDAAAAPAPVACDVLTLQRGQLHSVRHPQGRQVRCLEGRLWLTFERCPVDVFLDPGESLHCGTCQRLVIQALEPARCRIA